MALDTRLSEKWGRKVYDWTVWLSDRGPSISAAYAGPRTRSGNIPDSMCGEALDTDTLMGVLRAKDKRLHAAILEYVQDKGTRGAQAARLSIHPDTYRARVNGAMVLLELMHNAGRRTKPHPPTHARP